uniref:Uncharacterized protein n=1 Tax=Ixodes scapularis TaxID=6945 RepID=A0A4D5RCD6_IXOSC
MFQLSVSLQLVGHCHARGGKPRWSDGPSALPGGKRSVVHFCFYRFILFAWFRMAPPVLIETAGLECLVLHGLHACPKTAASSLQTN